MSSSTAINSPRAPLFDAFFWLEPTRDDKSKPFTNARILWQYPENTAPMNAITSEFTDLVDYCYPDLHNLSLENVKEGKSDHSFFTWTNRAGIVYYGICYRYLFRGMSRRFDVSRRSRHCLCLLSRYPFYSFFKNLLMDIYSFGLLEMFPTQCKAFTHHMLNFLLTNANATSGTGGTNGVTLSDGRMFTVDTFKIHQATHLPKHLLNGIVVPDFTWVLPTAGSAGSGSGRVKSYVRDVPILPLLQALGVEKFFKLVSALLTERSILIMADSIQVVSDAVLAALSLLHPFSWRHDVITSLSKKQLKVLGNTNSTSRPFLIGLQRVPSQELRRYAMNNSSNGGIILVDMDAGEIISTAGNVQQDIRDLLGDAGTALKQATESLDRVRAGLSSVFLGKNSDNNDLSGGSSRDLMAMLVQDLKSSLASKPGTASIQSVASGLIRGLPGTGKTTNEAKVQWTYECEKTIRDSLTCFYAFLFADIEDYLLSPQQYQRQQQQQGYSSKNGRSRIDFNRFIDKKRASGASSLILDFLQDFVNTTMFSAFLDEKAFTSGGSVARERDNSSISRLNRASSTTSTSSDYSTSTYGNVSTAGIFPEIDELFDIICMDLRYRGQTSNSTGAASSYNANIVKQLISSRSALGVNENSSAFQTSSASSFGQGNVNKVPSTNFHLSVLQFTSATSGTSSSTSMVVGSSDESTDVLVNHNFTAEYAEDFGLFSLQVNPTRRNLLTTTSPVVISNLERILNDCYHHDTIRKVFLTIQFRLEACKAANCRGNSGLSGLKALQLLQMILIQGPMQSLSFALDLIPLIRSLLRVNVKSSTSSTTAGSSGGSGSGNGNGSSNGTSGSNSSGGVAGLKGVALPSAALDLIGASGPVYDPKPLALATLSLLVDHRKLITQRTMITIAQQVGESQPCLRRIYRSQPTTTNVKNQSFIQPVGEKNQIFNTVFAAASTSQSAHKRGIPVFAKIHNHLNELKLNSIAAGSIRLTVPEKMSAEREDDDDNASSIGATSRRTTRSESAAVHAPPSISTNAANANVGKTVDLLDLSEENPNARYRVLNQDTGDIFDIREVAKNYEQFIPSPTPVRTAAGGTGGVKLAPPPPPAAAGARARKPASNASNAAPTTAPASAPVAANKDPFATDPWGTADPFASPAKTTSTTNSPPMSQSTAPTTSGKSSSYLADLSSIPAPSDGRSTSPAPVNNGLSGGRSVSPVPSIPNPYGGMNQQPNAGWGNGSTTMPSPMQMQMPMQAPLQQTNNMGSMQYQAKPPEWCCRSICRFSQFKKIISFSNCMD